MELTQSGVLLSFEVTFDNPSLFVAMKVFDDSGGSPALLSTQAMLNFFGNSYRARYTAVAGKTYLVHKAVYTDGTFVTLDPNYSQSSESFTAQDIASLVLDVQIGAHVNPGTVGEAISSGGSPIATQIFPPNIIAEIEPPVIINAEIST